MALGLLGASLVSGGLSLAGGLLGGRSAKKGMKQMARAIREATQFQREMYNRLYGDLAPYRELSTEALPYLRQAAGEESPLYRLRLEDTEKAINRYLASRGLFNSGVAGELLAQNARRLSAEEAAQRWARMMGLAELGFKARGLGGRLGVATGSNVASTQGVLGQGYLRAGENLASIYGNTAAGINQAIQGGLSNYYFNQFLDRLGGGVTSSPNLPAVPDYAGMWRKMYGL